MIGRRSFLRGAACVGLAALASTRAAKAGTAGLPVPSASAVCPVCGMFVAKFPEWLAGVEVQGGHVHYFDGPKDMFKFLADPGRYVPGLKGGDIVRAVVTDYYAVLPLDARKALFVAGSDILGPMGHELIPLASPADAEAFIKDHGGRTPIGFDQVTPDVIAALDKG